MKSGSFVSYKNWLCNRTNWFRYQEQLGNWIEASIIDDVSAILIAPNLYCALKLQAFDELNSLERWRKLFE